MPAKTQVSKYYHGTLASNLQSIRKGGLRPADFSEAGKGATGFKDPFSGPRFLYDQIGSVAVTTSQKDAIMYSAFAGMTVSDKTHKDLLKIPLIVLEIDAKKLDVSRLKLRPHSGMTKGAREFDYSQVIPADAITAVWCNKHDKTGWHLSKDGTCDVSDDV
ncbi:Uncharacterised protein [uncultured archaeon]|nr:Uncharacterised protein [uncultured archaeon]